jgi:hypothetical protein
VIQNLEEGFLYARLPEGLVSLDERGLIASVVGGYQDRVEDLRSYSKKLELLFQTSGLPETGNNVVMVDITSPQGKVYTRSLDLQTDTPPDGTAALTTWVLQQLGFTSTDNIANIRYGRDLLRLVDVNTLDHLAATIGAVLYQSSALTDAEQATANQQILQTYFPRLKFKGTARSFETLGRILGFDDVKVTPLWGRLSPHVPNDIGSPTNDPDFKATPDYQPQQQIDDFYDPLKTNDGPYASWSGTIAPGTASTQFATQVVNGFNPWVNVEVLAVQYGTATLPAAGSYALEGGAPHRKAAVEVNDLRFEAVAEGEWFNGIEVRVANSGSNRALSILDRLSSVKYRSSYFDLAITAEFDRVEELYGSSAMKRNKDLAADPNLTPDGTAVSPYRPWTAGSITTGLHEQDWLVQQGSNSPTVVTARVQSSGTTRQLNVDELVSAGVQVVQALEEVRPATRLARKAGIGFLIRDDVGYAAYIKESLLVITANGEGTFTPNIISASWDGSHVDTPASPFYAMFVIDDGTTKVYPEAVVDPLNPNGFLFKSPGFDGTYDFTTGTYVFTFTPPYVGTHVSALWYPASTEVIRTEPAAGTEKGYQARPEDQENGNLDEVADDFPWRRDLTLGGEVVDVTVYDPIAPDALTEPAENVMSIPGHDGAEYSVFAISSAATPIQRLVTAVRSIGADYKHGMMATAYKGTLKNLPAVSDVPGLTELERFFEPGAKLYTVGSVQGVLVADPNKFYSTAHRDGLVGWFPFNEHPDDDLTVKDRSAIAGDLQPISAFPNRRLWDDMRGWYLSPFTGAVHYSTADRLISSQFALSFWFFAGGTSGNVFKFGLLRIDYDSATEELKFYYDEQFIGSVFPTFGDTATLPVAFVTVSVAPEEIILGLGDLDTDIVRWHFPGTYAEMPNTDLAITGQQVGWSDLRIWNVLKTEDELNTVRNYEPVDTQTAYQVGTLKNVNTHDRYGLRVLECGLVAVAPLPAWYTEPRVSFVTRYDSLGRYGGESRFKEVGLGGGPPLPDSFKLGVQFQSMTADADAVVSTASGVMPGENKQWLDANVPPNYLKIIHTGSDAYEVWVSSGTSSPWPNPMVQTNTGQDAIWVLGDDGYMYEVALVSSGTGAALVADLIARQRTDSELQISSFGTEDWNLLRYSEQPTGAQTIIASGGTILTVGSHGTSVYQKAFSGTYDTPPAFLYLNSRVVADVENAWEQWTENTDDRAFGNLQTPPVAALNEDGVLEFTNSGTITPGNYRLTVVSGNIGKADSDFDGFRVEITADATIIEKNLCEGQSGYNFRGTDAFEFAIDNGVVGEWLLSFDWFNALSDPARGTARQLAIYSYKLERLTTELYKVAIGGGAVAVTQVNTSDYYGTAPGGWIASINSYGSVSGYQHESTVYPTQDTITLKTPLSEILTGATIERREDVIGPSGIVLTNGTVPVMPSFGTIMDAGTNSFDPVWLWSGGVTGGGVALAAKVAINSPAVRFAVSLYGTIGPDAIYSDVLVASDDNSNTVKANVDGLVANETYYYGVEMGGSLAAGFIGQFKTFDASTRNFSFALGSCSNNQVSAAVNPILFDHILDKDPLFFIHMGDMHYNDLANEPHSIASYHNCWDKVFQLSSRQRRFWQHKMVEYIWDDHDYGPNDSAGNWEFKKFARLAFQQTVPTYPLAAGSGNVPLYRSWSVGRCFFIMIDTRSEATPQSVTDGPDKTRLGFAQKIWLKQQLLFGAAHYAFTFIINPTTWGGATSAGADTWAGYAHERQEILDFIVDNGLTGIAMLAGDMHGCAFDDGTNNAFSTGNKGGLAILQAAPLDQSASQKGTPYLDGPYPNSGSANRKQYGLVTVTDSGTGTPYITFEAFDDTTGTDTQLFAHSFYGTQTPKP